MQKQHVPAGTEVDRGVYQCNACANEIEVKEDQAKLPPCEVCDSFSWRLFRSVPKGEDQEDISHDKT